jgi:hypothetical protein
MSFPTTSARLSFHGFGEPDSPAPNPTRARIDAVCSGQAEAEQSARPESRHRVHGRIPTGRDQEIRITTVSGRLWIRPWHMNADGEWWPVQGGKGVQVWSMEATAFKQAVAEACEAIEGEAKP